MRQTDVLKSVYREWIQLCRKAEGVGLESAKEYREELENEYAKLGEPLYLMIVGEGDAGKSALVNAFLERTVAEVGVLSKTWCISMYIPDDLEDYAELILKDKTRCRVSIDVAKKIDRALCVGSEEGDLQESEIDKSYYDIVEFRKHYKGLPWPPPGLDVVIIDTPGFSQVRFGHEETKQSTIKKFDEAQGIHFENSDGFESYYSKADIVLWCVPYTDTGDSEFDRHIRQVAYQNKEVYAVITKVDELDEKVNSGEITDSERNENRQAAINDLKKYPQIRGYIETKLPPISKLMEPGMQRDLAAIHNVTSKQLQEYATSILKQSGKDVVRERGLQTIQYKLITDIRALYDFYEKNYEVCQAAIEQIGYYMDRQGKDLEKNIRQRKEEYISGPLSDRAIREKWNSCKPSRDQFKKQMENMIANSELTSRCELEYANAVEEASGRSARIWESILWTEINMGALREKGSREKTKPFDLSKIQIPSARINIHELDLPGRFSNTFSSLVDTIFKKDEKKSHGLGSWKDATRTLKDKAKQIKDGAVKAVNSIKNHDEEIVMLTRECIFDELKTYQTQLLNEFHIWSSDTKKSFTDAIKEAYRNHTGMDYDACLFRTQREEFDLDIARLTNQRGTVNPSFKTRPAQKQTSTTQTASSSGTAASSKGTATTPRPELSTPRPAMRKPEQDVITNDNRMVFMQRDHFIAEWGPYLEQCAASGTISPEADCMPILYQYWYYNYYPKHPEERLIEVIWGRYQNPSVIPPNALTLFPSSAQSGTLSPESIRVLEKVRRDLEYEYVKHCDELSTKIYDREFSKRRKQLDPYLNNLDEYWRKWKTYLKGTPEGKKDIKSFGQFLEKNGLPKGLLDLEKTVASVRQYRRIQWSSGDNFEDRFRRDYRMLVDRVINYSD